MIALLVNAYHLFLVVFFFCSGLLAFAPIIKILQNGMVIMTILERKFPVKKPNRGGNTQKTCSSTIELEWKPTNILDTILSNILGYNNRNQQPFISVHRILLALYKQLVFQYVALSLGLGYFRHLLSVNRMCMSFYLPGSCSICQTNSECVRVCAIEWVFVCVSELHMH